MTSRSQEHILIGQDFLARAEEALAQDDLLQASEKGWGAAAHTVKGVAESKGWLHNGHRELYQAVNHLGQEVGASEIRVLFSIASSLHSNFYENWMPREMIEANLAQVKHFLERLPQLA